MLEPGFGEAYLRTVSARFRSGGFEVTEHVPFGETTFRLVARRRRLEATKLGQAENVFVFSPFASIDPAGIRGFARTVFEFATKASLGGMPRGLGRAVFCYPVAIAPQVDEATSRVVRTQPPAKHFSANEIPVIVDLGTNTVHCFEKTPLWGAAYYRGFRKMIRTFLQP